MVRDGAFVRITEPVTGAQGEGTLTVSDAINLGSWLLAMAGVTPEGLADTMKGVLK